MRIICLVTIIVLLLSGCCTQHVSNPSAAKINAKLALAYLQQHQLTHAKSKLLLAINQSPHDPEVILAQAHFFVVIDEPGVATKYFLQAIQAAPNKSQARYDYGVFLYQQGDDPKALKYLLLAAQDYYFQNVTSAYWFASKAAARLGQRDLAKKYHNKVTEVGSW